MMLCSKYKIGRQTHLNLTVGHVAGCHLVTAGLPRTSAPTTADEDCEASDVD